jgi:hypothetical protein
MTTDQLTVLDATRPKSEASRLSDLIGGEVLQSLGTPSGLRGVRVKRLWEDHYRANVVVGEDALSAKVAHSFFVVADSSGKIVTSEPAIQRQYP